MADAKGSPTTPTPHDALFKSVFSIPENAASELGFLLPAAIQKQLDLSQLQLEPGSFIDEQLRASCSDLLFTAPVRPQPSKTAFVYVLYEHLSEPPKQRCFALRLLKYMTGIWQQFLDQHPKATQLPVIVPVVLYHGHQPWALDTRFSSLFDLGQEAALSAFVPNFSFLLDDVSHTPDEALRTRQMLAHAKTALWFLKVGREGKRLLQELDRWAEELEGLLGEPTGKKAFLTLVRYYLMMTQAPTLHEVQQRFTQVLGAKVEKTIMTLGETLVQQGKLEGLQQGKLEGRCEGEAEAVLEVLEARGFALTAAQRACILGCTDLTTLKQWVRKAAIASSLEQIFGLN